MWQLGFEMGEASKLGAIKDVWERGNCCGLKGGHAKRESKAHSRRKIGAESLIVDERGVNVRDKSCG